MRVAADAVKGKTPEGKTPEAPEEPRQFSIVWVAWERNHPSTRVSNSRLAAFTAPQ
jgi:hypothetical protein